MVTLTDIICDPVLNDQLKKIGNIIFFRKNYYTCANLNSPKTEQVLLLACEQEQSYASTSQALCTHFTTSSVNLGLTSIFETASVRFCGMFMVQGVMS